jgi:oligogalacturonide lyase
MKVSRRGFAYSLAAAFPSFAYCADSSVKGRTLPSVAARYFDPATEFLIVRLTDPQFSSVLPSSSNRILTSRAMLYASNQTGRWEAFRMDLKNRESRQLTDAEGLDVNSLALTPGDKGFWHYDGARLFDTPFGSLKSREVYRTPDGVEKTPGISYAEDGQHAAFVEKSNGQYRLRLLQPTKGSAATILEAPDEIRDVMIRPKHASLFYRIGNEPRMINFDGQQSKPLALAEGENSQAQWSADGHVLLYLNHPASGKRTTTLREFHPDTESGAPGEARVGETTQFARFSANNDASVFVGTSGSKAAPYVLLLTRVAKRELTLAEHRASDPAITTPVFSPNSQFILFGSDRHGRPAIYWIAVDKFVADTEGS